MRQAGSVRCGGGARGAEIFLQHAAGGVRRQLYAHGRLRGTGVRRAKRSGWLGAAGGGRRVFLAFLSRLCYHGEKRRRRT